MVKDFRFEVCLQSVEGAIAAQDGGAHRVELCSALVEGGLTPSWATIKACRSAIDLPIMVMIRPRGGDFDYSDLELDIMEADIRACCEIGVSGIVFGVLDREGKVAGPQVRRLVEAAGTLSVTFHRAFDVCHDPFRALEALIELGVDRILTSGQAATVPEGLPLIRELVIRAGDRIGILPGCGITPDNVVEVLEQSGAREFHATAFGPIHSRMRHRNPSVYMGIPGLPEYERQGTSKLEVTRFITAIGG